MPRVGRASPSEDRGGGSIELDRGYPSPYRLHTAAEYSAVFSARRVLRGSYFDLHYGPGGKAGARLGLIIAKKLVARAVQRNLLKRLAREAFRQLHGDLSRNDLVLRLARPPGLRMDTQARRLWRADIVQLLASMPR